MVQFLSIYYMGRRMDEVVSPGIARRVWSVLVCMSGMDWPSIHETRLACFPPPHGMSHCPAGKEEEVLASCVSVAQDTAFHWDP